MGIVSTARSVVKSIAGAVRQISGAPMPDRAAVLSEPTPAEAGVAPRQADYGTDAELVKLVSDLRKEAMQQRRPAERDWVLNIAAYFGGSGQWLTWNDKDHCAASLMLEGKAKCRYVVHNLIKPLVKKRIALSTMSKPDAQVAAAGPSPIDQDAASEARCITAHLSRLWKLPNQMLEAAWWADVCGIAWRKSYWDPSMIADIAYFDAERGQIGKKSAKVGELCSSVTPPFEVLVIGGNCRYEKAKGIMHYRDLSLSEVLAIYGDRAKGIEPDTIASPGYIDSYMPETRRLYTSNREKNAVRVCEYWEFATPDRFENGRLIVTTETHLLYADANPLEGTDAKGNPFARVVFEDSPNHPYGSSDVTDMRDIQIDINRLLTKSTTAIEDAKNTLVINKQAGLAADDYADEDVFGDFHEDRNKRVVHINPGVNMIPIWQQQPTIGSALYQQLELNWQHMQHIAGIHDVQQGSAPAGVTAGISIELLQQSDRSQLSLFTGRIEQYAVDFYTTDIAIYGKYASRDIPRLMGIDDSGDPQQAQSRAMAFRALTGGGTVRVLVLPGSATPKSPAGQKQEILDYKNAGLFDIADPGADIAVALLPGPLSGRILELRKKAKDQAMREQQAAMQSQMQMQQEQMAQQAQMQAANQPPPPEPTADPREVEAAKTQLRMHENDQKAKLDERKTILQAAIQMRMEKANGSKPNTAKR